VAKVVIVLNDADDGLEMEFKSDEPMMSDDAKKWSPAQMLAMVAVQHIGQLIEEFKGREGEV